MLRQREGLQLYRSRSAPLVSITSKCCKVGGTRDFCSPFILFLQSSYPAIIIVILYDLRYPRLDYSNRGQEKRTMQQLIDFMPVLAFVSVFFLFDDIYLATVALMIGAGCQILLEKILFKNVRGVTKAVFAVIIISGGLTIALQNDVFIKWKPTIVNWLFGFVLVFSSVLLKENLLKRMAGKMIQLEDEIWMRLNYGWSLGFLIAGLLNLGVAYTFSTEIWVTYKFVGGPLISLFYIAITMGYLAKGGYRAQLDKHEKKDV